MSDDIALRGRFTRWGDPTHHLTDELPGALDSSPGADVGAVDGGLPGAGHGGDEALVRDDRSVEVDLCKQTVRRMLQ